MKLSAHRSPLSPGTPHRVTIAAVAKDKTAHSNGLPVNGAIGARPTARMAMRSKCPACDDGTLSRPYAGPPDLEHRRRGNARITTHSRARTKKAASRENRTMAFEFSPRAEEALSSQFIAPDAQGGFFGAGARMSPRSSPAEAATRRSQARPCRGLDLMKRVKKEL
jgi:hypothetical protein